MPQQPDHAAESKPILPLPRPVDEGQEAEETARPREDERTEVPPPTDLGRC